MKHTKYTNLMTGGAMAATLLMAYLAPAVAQGTVNTTLESGTVIPVRLRNTLSSSDSRKGDRFTAILQSEDAARSLHVPRGTSIEGTVASVRPQQGKDPGVISLHFNRMVLPNEASYPIQGSLIGLDDKSVRRTENGRLVANPDQKNKTLMYAGYGAGAGLLLGAITRGNTILDTLLGGGLGYLLGTTDKSHGEPKDVTLKPDTEMGVRLDHSVQISTYEDNRGRDDSYTDPSPRNQPDRNDDRSGGYHYGEQGSKTRDEERQRAEVDRDAYDDAPAGRQTVGNDSYQVLRQFTDVRDNGRPVRVIVDGHSLAFLPSARPFIANGIVMVPAVPVLKAAHIPYDYAGGRFTANGPGEPLTVTLDSRIAKGSSTHQFTLPATVQRRNGTTYVPMQFLAIVTGQKLNFDRDSQTLEFGDTGLRSASFQH